MLSSFHDFPWTGVIAGVATFAGLGAIYFMALFPRQYLYAIGQENVSKTAQPKPGVIFIIGPMVCSLLNVIGDAYLVRALDAQTIGQAAFIGLIVGVGFLVPMVFNIAINPLFPRPLRYGLLNAPYFLVANVVACVLLVAI